MASDNVDLVRSIFADWERGDFSRTDWADAALELVSVDGPEPSHWHGLVAASQAWKAYLSAWQDLRARGEGYRELDDGRVLVLVHNAGRGRTSEVDMAHVGGRGANVFRFRERKVIELALYFERDRAFADLGLTPEGKAADRPD